MTMAVNAALNHIASVMDITDPVLVLQALHREMQTILHQDDMGESFENGFDAGVCYWAWNEPLLYFATGRGSTCIIKTQRLRRRSFAVTEPVSAIDRPIPTGRCSVAMILNEYLAEPFI